MKIINLTPHSISLTAPDGREVVVPPTLPTCRVGSTPGALLGSQVEECMLYSAPTWGEVENLPPPQDGVIVVVSGIVAGRCIGRNDVFSPGTGPNDGAIRDEKGLIKAVTRLIQAPLR